MCYGTEFTSNAILGFAERMKIDWHYIAPGKPIQNAFIEHFGYRSGAFMYTACSRGRLHGRWP